MKTFSYTYCTYFNHKYLPKGLELIDSLINFEPTAKIVVLCLDQESYQVLKRLKRPQVKLLKLSTLEKKYPDLLVAKSNRPLIEYTWTQTPFLCRYLLDVYKTGAVYLDADMVFYSSPQPVLDELGNNSIAISPHRYPPYNDRSNTSGRFNVGFNIFKNDRKAKKVLMLWSQDCLSSCTIDGETCGDQKYLDKWPSQFDGIHIISHRGSDCAPWNFYGLKVDQINGQYFINGEPMIFFHFHGLNIRSHSFFWPNVSYPITYHELVLYLDYIKRLKKQINIINKVNPNLDFGLGPVTWSKEASSLLTAMYVNVKKLVSPQKEAII